MNFNLLFTPEAARQLEELERTDSKKHRQLLEILGNLETDLSHPELTTVPCQNFQGPEGQTLYQTYGNPMKFGIFWYYGLNQGNLTIVCILEE